MVNPISDGENINRLHILNQLNVPKDVNILVSIAKQCVETNDPISVFVY